MARASCICDATWAYPDFHLEDVLFRGEGGSVVDSFVGRTYQRRLRNLVAVAPST
jgi:hypothetical protein